MAEMVGSAVVHGRQRMAEMVGSAVVQEVVSGAFSFMRNSHEETQSRLMERLQMAHMELKFALERSRKMPITEVSLLQRRMVLKYAFEECCEELYKHTLKGVPSFSPSLPNRIMHAVKLFVRTENGSISRPCVRRFEWFAEKADKFVRDLESGCSLALYRFSSPLITQLLEGTYLHYGMASGSQARTLSIFPSCLEDYGEVAFLIFQFKDLETPMKCFTLQLMLRLSESTDIVGISTKCLQSLEPQFKSLADVVSGELAQISTQVGVFRPKQARQERMFNLATDTSRSFRQEPLCCIGDGLQTSAKNIPSSELTEKFPEQVSYLCFQCFISAAEYNLLSSAIETNRSTINSWPILELTAAFLPHFLWKTEVDQVCTYLVTSRGEFCGPLGCLDISEMGKFVPVLAVSCFMLEPDRTEYTILWRSAHGLATFTVSKPTTEMKCAPKVGDGSKTRRASKRKR